MLAKQFKLLTSDFERTMSGIHRAIPYDVQKFHSLRKSLINEFADVIKAHGGTVSNLEESLNLSQRPYDGLIHKWDKVDGGEIPEQFVNSTNILPGWKIEGVGESKPTFSSNIYPSESEKSKPLSEHSAKSFEMADKAVERLRGSFQKVKDLGLVQPRTKKIPSKPKNITKEGGWDLRGISNPEATSNLAARRFELIVNKSVKNLYPPTDRVNPAEIVHAEKEQLKLKEVGKKPKPPKKTSSTPAINAPFPSTSTTEVINNIPSEVITPTVRSQTSIPQQTPQPTKPSPKPVLTENKSVIEIAEENLKNSLKKEDMKLFQNLAHIGGVGLLAVAAVDSAANKKYGQAAGFAAMGAGIHLAVTAAKPERAMSTLMKEALTAIKKGVK